MRSEKGETLISLLVSIGLSSIVFAAVVNTFVQSTRYSSDHNMMLSAQEEAKSIADLLAFELRLTGAGMALGQGYFSMTDTTLGDAPLPVLTNATSTSITVRFNEKGKFGVLTSSFNPAAGVTVNVNNTSAFVQGDTVYISDLAAGGNYGLKGVVSSVGGSSITLSSGAVYKTGATFASGSRIEPVREVIFNSPSDWSGITRDGEFGPIKLSPNSTFSLQYRDSTGATLSTPLTAATIKNNLAAVVVNVNVRSPRHLKSGLIYTAQAQHTVSLRNLILGR